VHSQSDTSRIFAPHPRRKNHADDRCVVEAPELLALPVRLILNETNSAPESRNARPGLINTRHYPPVDMSVKLWSGGPVVILETNKPETQTAHHLRAVNPSVPLLGFHQYTGDGTAFRCPIVGLYSFTTVSYSVSGETSLPGTLIEALAASSVQRRAGAGAGAAFIGGGIFIIRDMGPFEV